MFPRGKPCGKVQRKANEPISAQGIARMTMKSSESASPTWRRHVQPRQGTEAGLGYGTLRDPQMSVGQKPPRVAIGTIESWTRG